MLNAARIAELKEEVGEDDFEEVFGLFCEEVEDVLQELSTNTDLAEKLHFLKGSAMNLGFDAVGDLCRTEEARLKADPAASIDIAAIQQAYTLSKSCLLG